MIELIAQKLRNWFTRQQLIDTAIQVRDFLSYYKLLIIAILINAGWFWLLGLSQQFVLSGRTAVATYHIRYLSNNAVYYEKELEALIERNAQALSIEDPNAMLAQLNQHDCSSFSSQSKLLYSILAKSKEVYRHTAGAFDPTVLPLVRAWQHDSPPTAAQLDAIKAYVGLDYIVANEHRIKKLKKDVQLGLGGIAPGYLTDMVADFLQAHGIHHAIVTVGQSIRVCGDRSWSTQFDLTTGSDAQDSLQVALQLKGRAASYECIPPEPQQRSIADPITGHLAKNSLRAVVVLAPDCSLARAYVTAILAQGLPLAQKLAKEIKNLGIFIVYEDDQGTLAFYVSENLQLKSSTEDTVQLNWVGE